MDEGDRMYVFAIVIQGKLRKFKRNEGQGLMLETSALLSSQWRLFDPLSSRLNFRKIIGSSLGNTLIV